MTKSINFHNLFTLLLEWFDTPTPPNVDLDDWRFQLYDEYSTGIRPRLPLKTWWPHYTDGDYRFELCIGALLVHQTSWKQVECAIKGIESHLVDAGKQFDAAGIGGIPLETLEELIRTTGFYRQKAKRITNFCGNIVDQHGSIAGFLGNVGRGRMDNECNREEEIIGRKLDCLEGFGRETRDSVLLYAANIPVFIADSYARKLLNVLGITDSKDYEICQRQYILGISRDFSQEQIISLVAEYTPDELAYALPNTPDQQWVQLILLYQQFHAGIDELGISKRWDEFKDELISR